MKRTARITLMALTLILIAGVASAEWIAFSREGKEVITKAKGSAQSFTLDVTVPGIDIIDREGYKAVDIPEQALLMAEQLPQLPRYATSIILPSKGMAKVTLLSVEEEIIDLKGKIIPSRGHQTRDKNLQDIPLVEGDVYKKDAFFPADDYKVEVGNPYILRDIRGVAIRLVPCLYNPVQGKLRVAKALHLQVEMVKGGVSVNDKLETKRPLCSEFKGIYAKLFSNWKLVADTKALPNEATGRALILCPDKWLDNMGPLMKWRAQKGLETKLVAKSDIPVTAEDPAGDEDEEPAAEPTADDIKAYIQTEYDQGNLAFILLVGDAEDMPCLKGVKEGADSDAMYVKLEGDDNHADAFISRFSCKNAAELDTQIARVLKYEKEPVMDGAFYRKAMGVASNQGNPSDSDRADLLREAELDWRYDSVDRFYDYATSSKTNITTAANEGRGLINYIGHGSKYMWVASRFNCDDVNALENTGGKWPTIWSVACVNGDFVGGSDCFGEAWAKAGTAADPKGAICFVGASTNMAWVPPCDWQSAIIKNYMIPGLVFTTNAMHGFGIEKAMEQWGDSDSSQGNMLLEQCILFGDGTVMMRNDLPKVPEVALVPAPEPQPENEPAAPIKLVVTVPGDEASAPVANARVIVRTALQGSTLVAVTGDDGQAEFSAADIQALRCDGDCGNENVIIVNVIGPNLKPVLDKEIQLPCEEPQDPQQPE